MKKLRMPETDYVIELLLDVAVLPCDDRAWLLRVRKTELTESQRRRLIQLQGRVSPND